MSFTVGDMGMGYLVTASIDEGSGSVTPAALAVPEGETATFLITPDTDYHIVSAIGCNGTLTGNTYQTGPIDSDCQVNIVLSDVIHVSVPLRWWSVAILFLAIILFVVAWQRKKAYS